MSIRTRVGTYIRTWGFSTTTGARKIAPLRIRGVSLRRLVDEGGAELRARPTARIYKGRNSRLVLGHRVELMDQAHLIFEGDGGTIIIGDGTFLNSRCEIRSRERVTIGAGCMLAFDVIVMDTDHHQLADTPSTPPTSVGDGVWIGARATVLKGVTIGDGAVVAAGAIVTRDAPARSLVAGIPAKVVRSDVTWSR